MVNDTSALVFVILLLVGGSVVGFGSVGPCSDRPALFSLWAGRDGRSLSIAPTPTTLALAWWTWPSAEAGPTM